MTAHQASKEQDSTWDYIMVERPAAMSSTPARSALSPVIASPDGAGGAENEEGSDDNDAYFFATPCPPTPGVADISPYSAQSNEDEMAEYYSPSLSPASNQGTISPASGDFGARDSLAIARHKKSSSASYHSHLAEAARDTKSEAKWISMLNNWWTTVTFKKQALKRRLRRGIPVHLRPIAWYRLSEIATLKNKFPDPQLIDVSKVGKQVLEDIDKDVDRTYPEHDLFTLEAGGRGQDSLRSILVWYAAVDADVEYCQGMSFVAGLLLTYFTAEEAFYCFYHCLHDMGLRHMYLPGLVDLQRRLHVLTQLGWVYIEPLWQHLTDQHVDPMMYATEWFMTLFCRGFDFALSTRVVEIFMFEGYKIIYRVALTILKSMEKQLMAEDFEGILHLLRNCNKTMNPAQIMTDSYTWPLRSAELRRYELGYDSLQKELLKGDSSKR